MIFGLLSIMLSSIGLLQPVSAQMMCAGGDEAFHFTINDIVFIGTVTAINPSDSHRLWNYISFDIQYSFKGLTNQSEIIVPTYQGSTYGFEPEIGSKYLIHASNAYGVDLFTSLCSDNKLLETEQDVEYMKNKLVEMNTPPPLKQKQYGIASHAIKCKENLVLIQKYDHSQACVKPETKENLIERGWTTFTPIKPEVRKIGTYELNQDGEIFVIKYHIQNGADIQEIIYDSDVQTIEIILDMVDESGSLKVIFPHKLFDSVLHEDTHDLFFVLIDGQEIDYDEITNETTRTLTIPFEKDSEIIKIIGAMSI